MKYDEFCKEYGTGKPSKNSAIRHVFITWLDSSQQSVSWHWLHELPKPKITSCHTSGFITFNDLEVLCVAQTFSRTKKKIQFMGITKLPACAIQDIQWISRDKPIDGPVK